MLGRWRSARSHQRHLADQIAGTGNVEQLTSDPDFHLSIQNHVHQVARSSFSEYRCALGPCFNVVGILEQISKVHAFLGLVKTANLVT